MAKERCVILSSGGLNSAVVTSIARHDYELSLLHVRLGHRASSREDELFAKQVEFFEAPRHLAVDMPHFAAIGGNARVSRKMQIEDALAMGEGKTNSYIPGLIKALLGVGFSWASVIGASKVYLGVSEDLGPPGPRTGSIYPDYAREHIEMCRHAYSAASPRRVMSIETPVIDLSRSDIVKLGHRLGTPFELTWSCISSNSESCGGCLGCATRGRGFLDAGLPDPIFASPTPEPVEQA